MDASGEMAGMGRRMTIYESKAAGRLPEEGTRVITRLNPKTLTASFLVADKNLKPRRDGVGIYTGYVPGAGGDVWWIEHEDKTVGAYCYDEVFDL